MFEGLDRIDQDGRRQSWLKPHSEKARERAWRFTMCWHVTPA
jgi:hypothetical protein